MVVTAMFIGSPLKSIIDGLSPVFMCKYVLRKWVRPTKFGPSPESNTSRILNEFSFEIRMSE